MKKRTVFLLLFSYTFISLFSITYAQTTKDTNPAMSESNLFTITRLVVGTDANQREPLGIANTYPSATPRVICFLDAADVKEDTVVSFVWILNDKELLKTDLPLRQGPRWRTRAEKKLYGQKGNWKVEIRNTEGRVLRDIQFVVE